MGRKAGNLLDVNLEGHPVACGDKDVEQASKYLL